MQTQEQILGAFCLDLLDYSWVFVRDEEADKALEALDSHRLGDDDGVSGGFIETNSFSPEVNTYQIVKERFEKECMKVRNPFTYIRLEKTGIVCKPRLPSQLKHTELKQFCVHWLYYKFEETKKEKSKRHEW